MKGVTRVTISLPDQAYAQLQEIIDVGKWKNRSQVITQLVRDEYVQLTATQQGNPIMAGSITLFYNESQREILNHVSQVQRENVNEVISSNKILLENDHVMEILVVQGYVQKLKEIQCQLLNIKGVEVGKLTLTNVVLPPIQSNKKEE